MTADQLRRAAGRAGLGAAVLGVPADLYHFTIDSRAEASASAAFRWHGIGLVLSFSLLLLALVGLVLAQQGRAGRLGSLGAACAGLGGCLVVGDLAKEAFALPLAPEALGDPTGYYLAVVVASFALLAVGWGMTAFALRRAGLLRGPAFGLLVLGAVLAFPPIPGAYVVLLVAVAVATQPLRSAATATAVARAAT